MPTTPNNPNKYNFTLPLLFAVVMVMGIQIGYKMYENLKLKGKIAPVTFYTSSTLDEVLQYIDGRYVDTVNSSLLMRDAIEHTLEKLDPHSSFIPSNELQEVNEQLDGNFEGIGIEFHIFNDTIYIVSAISGGPSEALGLLPGDKIVEIEDSTVAGIGINNAMVIKKLRGPKGSSVRIGIQRNTAAIKQYSIQREKIPLTSVDVGYKVNASTGYIKINRFSATTVDEFREKLIMLKEQNIENLIVDLRNNPGGFLDAATDIADEFLDKKRILVYTQGKNFRKKSYYSKRPGLFEEGELIILIDQGSASASEILAGAIQDWDRGTIIGRRSFGKGLVQEQYELQDGSALRLTVARYYTPTGRCIQRPYEHGDVESYYDDIDNRFENGELFSPDSIKFEEQECFVTPAGKEVYGGGGINPDIFIPMDTSGIEKFWPIRNEIPSFVYRHFSENQDDYLNKYKNLDDFLHRFDIGPVYKDFLTSLEKAKIRPQASTIQANKEEIQMYIKAYLARNLWYNNGFYPIINAEDPFITKALEELQK